MIDMQIFTAEHSGFCEGVARAYQIATEQMSKGRPVFMLGNLVHNTQVIDKFKSSGVKMVKTLEEIISADNGILLISAHGVSPEIYDKAKNLGLEVVDTTCPWVKKAQNIAKQLFDQGMFVLIVGDIGHAEVKGLFGWAGGHAQVIESGDDIKDCISDKKIGIIAQTTQSQENFARIVKMIKKKYPSAEVYNTICGATSKRQKAAVELAKKVELMLVIGDKMSANTKRLTELCQATGTETHQIQTIGELDKKWLKGKIGITAGASTPDWVIKEVINLLWAQ
ncbi:MAG: small subunit ribosomal protein S1 [Candidatus Saganbacteria bacterium]|uniref:4-hydroxy-3-methylbut-2-enyl diphosphate reductase n=1 Tax=Candidatus Saganbacteria bacterium TaxID=2575572 RepID=A0A833L0D6_UNCSA|nr:MAG: small subunit ribosomal protein S1 [Candidatus Saganbacteria bacterium]